MNRDTSNLTLFVESACSDHRLLLKAEPDELKEALIKCPTRIRESVSSEGNSGWWVPISFYNKLNGNRRNYTKQLWENVKNNQKDTWCGSAMLCDHPSGDSDGNPKDICGVWLDMKLGGADNTGKGLVYGLLMPSGRNGEDLQSHLQNGLKIGTSSSGFGKLMSDGVTVDPDTYMIERLADWVLNPSQGTFFSYDENNDSIEDRSMRESIDDIDIKESNNNIHESNTKETIMEDSAKLTKLEEKKFRRDMESFLERANSIRDPQERLEELKDIKGWLDDGACPDLKEKVEQKISEEEATIKQMLEERLEMKEELGVDSVRELKEKLTKVAEDTKLAEKEAKDWKTISEQLQDKLTETTNTLNNRPTNEFVSYQKTKISTLEETLKTHDSQAANVVKSLSESYKELKESSENLEKTVEALNAEKTELETKMNEAQAKAEEDIKNLTTYKEKYEELEPKYQKALKEIGLLKKVINKNKYLFEKAFKSTGELRESVSDKDKKIENLDASIRNVKKTLKENEAKRVLDESMNLSETEQYYESLYSQYGKEMENFRDRIINAINLTEAKKVFFREVLPNMNESQEIESMRLPESIQMSMEDRAKIITNAPLQKTSALSRKPRGWR